MKLHQELAPGMHYIHRYEFDMIAVGEQEFRDSVVISPQGVHIWPVKDISAVSLENLQTAIAQQPKILILGTGVKQTFPERQLLVNLVRLGIGLEVMTTPAACRTYNILLGEGRSVAAALIL